MPSTKREGGSGLIFLVFWRDTRIWTMMLIHENISFGLCDGSRGFLSQSRSQFIQPTFELSSIVKSDDPWISI